MAEFLDQSCAPAVEGRFRTWKTAAGVKPRRIRTRQWLGLAVDAPVETPGERLFNQIPLVEVGRLKDTAGMTEGTSASRISMVDSRDFTGRERDPSLSINFPPLRAVIVAGLPPISPRAHRDARRRRRRRRRRVPRSSRAGVAGTACRRARGARTDSNRSADTAFTPGRIVARVAPSGLGR